MQDYVKAAAITCRVSLLRWCVLCGAGYPEYELKEGGSEVAVDRHNVGDYINAVVDATLHTGIKEQMQAFRRASNTGCARL